MFIPGAATIAKWDRPAAYYRVLLFCMATLDSQQLRALSAREIKDGTGLSLISVERALAMLEADKVICTNGQKTAARRRRLSNHLCWSSRADAHHAAMPDPALEDGRGR